MSDQIWVNPRQPQTLYISQILLYIRGAFAILFGMLFSVTNVELFGSRPLGAIFVLLLTVGMIAAGFGIANEKRWGYLLGIAAAVAATIPIAIPLLVGDTGPLSSDPIGLMFDIALVVALLHPMSREYQKIWFR